MGSIEICGLYIIKDSYFNDFPSKFFMQNKEENRPHYYAIKDSDGMLWMIPLSSQIQKYREKISNTERQFGKNSCFMYMVAPIHGNDRAILICDMFPITEEYILRPYTIGGKPYIIQNDSIRKAISKKAKRYLSMVKRGEIKNPIGVLQIKEALMKK